MSELPHVMSGIVGPLVLGNEDKPWLLPKYLRRGRLTEAAVTLLAKGQKIPDDWWSRHSGEAEDDRVEHEECRGSVDGGRKFLAEVPCQLIAVQREVIHPLYGYQGHIDWLALLQQVPSIVDLKNGEPPTPDSPLDWAYRMQLAFYALALAMEERPSPRNYKRYDLHLFDGTYKLIDRSCPSDLRDARIMRDYYTLSRKWSKA